MPRLPLKTVTAIRDGRGESWQMKKKIAITLLLVLIAVAGVQSVANYTAARKATGVITAGSVQLKINQSSEGKDGEEIEPGSVRANRVSIENTGKSGAYVRAEIRVLSEGKAIEAEDVLELDIDRESWIYEGGYYYYTRELKSGEETEALYTEESFLGEALEDKYAGKEIEVEITAYGVQSSNNGEEALKAEGWPERKEGGYI